MTDRPIPSPPEGVRCECGGVLRRTKLAAYDFTDYIGFQVTLKDFEGLKCDKCGDETLDGRLVNAVMNFTVFQVVRQPRRLNGPEARYLRHFLDATQEDLATRMGIVRETVAKWECGDTAISSAYDYMLRGISLGAMIGSGLIHPDQARKILGDALGAIRSMPPEKGASIMVLRSDIDFPAKPAIRAAAG